MFVGVVALHCGVQQLPQAQSFDYHTSIILILSIADCNQSNFVFIFAQFTISCKIQKQAFVQSHIRSTCRKQFWQMFSLDIQCASRSIEPYWMTELSVLCMIRYSKSWFIDLFMIFLIARNAKVWFYFLHSIEQRM